MPHWFIVQSDCISRHYDTASLEHSANETFMVSVQVWHLWVMTFMYCLHSKYMSIIAARSYCLILYLLLWVSVVGHNWLPCQCFFVIRISLLSLLCLLCVSFFLRDFYITVYSGDGSHHHYFCCYICKVLSSDSTEQNPSVQILVNPLIGIFGGLVVTSNFLIFLCHKRKQIHNGWAKKNNIFVTFLTFEIS